MSGRFEFTPEGIIKRNGEQVGYIEVGSETFGRDLVFAGGIGRAFGKQVGWISDDAIFAGDGPLHSGRQVGYLSYGSVYEGGAGVYGGHQVGPVEMPYPEWAAAAFFLLS